MSGIFALLSLALFFFGFSGNAAAAPPDTPPRGDCITVAPPTKTVIIQNNSTDTTIYPVIQVPIYSNQPVSGSLPIPADLWMQAQCGITNQESSARTFPTSTVNLTASQIFPTMPGHWSRAAWASRQPGDDGGDQPSAHRCDRVWDVPFGTQRRSLWVGNRRIPQVARTAGRDQVLRGGIVSRSEIRNPYAAMHRVAWW